MKQTMADFEVVAVNDGSTDRSLEILREYEKLSPKFTVIDQTNAGQGSARNRALEAARGRYVLFVDADDFIEPVTLRVVTDRAEADRSDMVHFDWRLLAESSDDQRRSFYYNVEPFWHKQSLTGPECDELLQVKNFYSVCNLYRRSHLEQHHIRFEEGRIYEDNPFVVQAVNRAQQISLVHSPLYVVCPHPLSSTQSGVSTDRHFLDHVHAVKRSFEVLDRRNARAAAYLAAYHVTKFWQYYRTRVPRPYRAAYIREFVNALHSARVKIPEDTPMNQPTRWSVRLGIFQKRRYALFRAIIFAKNLVMPRYKSVVNYLRKLKRRNDPRGAWSAELEHALEQDVVPGTISFLGLDFRYTGSSRFLFEQLLEDPRFASCVIRFVTKDPQLPDEYRLTPGIVDTNVALARSEVVIAESWIPPRIRKHRDSTWVQLWHGTPIKRMLFDSHEPQIISRRKHHKTAKYRDIQNWDYLVVDSEAAAEKFEAAFLFDRDRMIFSGYPRVKYLLEHEGDIQVRDAILSRLGISDVEDRKIVLYAPTWRDYNYGTQQGQADYGYVIEPAELAARLGEEWLVLFHDHSYISSRINGDDDRFRDVSAFEIQELLLVADVLISDYSSVVFDALAIDRQVVLYASDLSKFEASRGVYTDVWADLADLAASDIDDLVVRIRRGEDAELQQSLREKYAFQQIDDLVGLIESKTTLSPQ